jgi:hypothetical protein
VSASPAGSRRGALYSASFFAQIISFSCSSLSRGDAKWKSELAKSC